MYYLDKVYAPYELDGDDQDMYVALIDFRAEGHVPREYHHQGKIEVRDVDEDTCKDIATRIIDKLNCDLGDYHDAHSNQIP